MKKNIGPFISAIIVLLFTFSSNSLFPLEVDIDEIKKAKKVKFINYRGRPKKIDSVSGVMSIGGKLARGVRRIGPNKKFRYHMKYSIIHAVSEKEKDRISADIFSIDKKARVDHVKNIRRIISGYLRSMYGYSVKNSDTISFFLLYYNAVYRGNIEYFKSIYKTTVLRHINKKNAGISTKYYKWPGRTKMLIPLTVESKRGKLDSIDPFLISDKKTRGQIRKKDMHIDKRKDMAEIKTKVIDKEKKKIEKEKKELKKKREKLDEDKKKLTEKKKEIDKKETDLKKEKESAKKIKDKKKREIKEKEIKKKEKVLKEEKDRIKKDKKKADEKEEEIKKEEEKIIKKTEEIEKKEDDLKEEKHEIEKDEIKKDIKKQPDKAEKKLREKAEKLEEKEKELDKREDRLRDKKVDKSIYAEKLYYLKIKEYLKEGHYNNELYMINAATRKIEFKSPVTNICGKRYDIFSDGIVVITHSGNHSSGHYLTLIDRKTLKTKIIGKDNIFWRSFVEIKDGHIYAIIKKNNDYYLGKFDNRLKLTNKSGEKINENTFISFYGDYIYINSSDKKIIVLSRKDLSMIDTIKP